MTILNALQPKIISNADIGALGLKNVSGNMAYGIEFEETPGHCLTQVCMLRRDMMKPRRPQRQA